jgi:hypothetical protein
MTVKSSAKIGVKRIWGKKIFTLLAVLAFISLTITGVLAEQQPSAEYIAQKIYDRDTGRDSHATVIMKLIEKDGQSRVREMEVWRKDSICSISWGNAPLTLPSPPRGADPWTHMTPWVIVSDGIRYEISVNYNLILFPEKKHKCPTLLKGG